MIYDEKMFKAFVGTDKHYNGEAKEEANITEADIQAIIRLILRISHGYNCKGGDGGCTWEEGQVAEILERVYRCGQEYGEQYGLQKAKYEIERMIAKY